jgi:hypothetical protein
MVGIGWLERVIIVVFSSTKPPRQPEFVAGDSRPLDGPVQVGSLQLSYNLILSGAGPGGRFATEDPHMCRLPAIARRFSVTNL